MMFAAKRTAALVSARAVRSARGAWNTPRLLNTIVTGPARPVASFNPPRRLISSSRPLSATATSTAPDGVPQTLTEKIVQNYSIGLPAGKKVKAGDYVTLSPHHCMTHDNSWPVALKFMSMNATKIHDNRQVVMTLDHDVQNKSPANLKKYQQIEEFAKQQSVDFFPAGRGIGHQIMVEEGYAWPGTLTVASDSHSNMYGGIGCLGTPVVRTDAASIWATGRTWWQIPPIAKVTFTGVLQPGVTGKDVIVALCGLFNEDEVLNHAIEFAGRPETMASLPVDDRLTIANMTTEWGALAGLFPVDDVLISWLRGRSTTAAMLDSKGSRFTHEKIQELAAQGLAPDEGATYAKSLFLDLSTLQPFVAGPNSVKLATPVKMLEEQNIKVDKAYLVSCTNSRASDIKLAADIIRGATGQHGAPAKISDGVKFYIAAASTAEQHAAEEDGDWQVLLDAGATPLPSGCGPCIGLGTGLLEPGEVGISASNRNFKGRMGSIEAKAYLASPEIVAASAIQGKIAGSGRYQAPFGVEKVILGEGEGNLDKERAQDVENALDKALGQMQGLIDDFDSGEGAAKKADEPVKEETLTPVHPQFPKTVQGEIVFCDADNINTDGIYPGKYTYQDGLTTEQMAKVCMQNYDEGFNEIAKPGDILVSGYNFGCGSSREQAATAILAKDIRMVVAGSFGNIFSRNSINNALMGVEVPKLVKRLREKFKGQGKSLTRRTGWWFTWDVQRSLVTVREGGEGTAEWTQKVGDLPPNVQEIIALGGLEKWVKVQIGG